MNREIDDSLLSPGMVPKARTLDRCLGGNGVRETGRCIAHSRQRNRTFPLMNAIMPTHCGNPLDFPSSRIWAGGL